MGSWKYRQRVNKNAYVLSSSSTYKKEREDQLYYRGSWEGEGGGRIVSRIKQ